MKANKIAVLLLITGLLIGCTSTSTDAAIEDTPEPQKESQLNTREEFQKSDSTMSILRDVYIILGRPAKYEITARVITSKQTSTCIEYGTQPGSYTKKTDKQPASRETPANFVLSGLSPETRYYYRIVYSASTDSLEKKTDEYSFITARISSSPYTFIIQSDSHLLNKADKPLYAKNMYEMKELNPDFIFDLGDTFLNDKDIETPFSVINDICFEQVPYLSIIAQTAPLFLVIGNHEGEYGFFLDNTKDNMSVYAALSRKQYFPNPVPNTFYSGNVTEEPFIGKPENYYAFEWGDALFVALDPYRYTLNNPQVTRDSWEWTIGTTQYEWLRKTLRESKAKYKFVFAHHAIGNIRGGARVAGLYEWGGKDPRGKDLFQQKRPEWEKPIHQLMNDTGVTIFFQGHDHIFAREKVDTVTYQTLPKPAEVIPDQESNLSYYEGGDVQINTGYLSVAVSSEVVQVDYHRVYVSGQPENKNIGIVYSYTVDSSGNVHVLKKTDDTAAFEAYGRETRENKDKSGDKQKKNKKEIDLLSEEKKNNADKDKSDKKSKADAVLVEMSGSLDGEILLGMPTDNSIIVSTFFSSDTKFSIHYGSSPDNLINQTPEKSAAAGTVIKETISGLVPGKTYYYQLFYSLNSSPEIIKSDVHHFSTQKMPGTPFTCIIEADPHLDENSSGEAYESILTLMGKAEPDFIIDLGDASMAEKLASNIYTYNERNKLIRSYWDNISGSIPFFMVLGNHDGEHGWKTKRDMPTSEQAAEIRRNWFVNPIPGSESIYSGPGDTIYGFEWGDALFMILDPYAFSKNKSAEDGWSWTLGKEQYNWLKTILTNTKAKYRFVFIHHLVGGNGRNNRGGADAAQFFEWGGLSAEGTDEFALKRAGWDMPIHNLLVKYHVDIVFHGHDHFYAYEEKDGIIYQLVPQPSNARPQKISKDIQEYGYTDGLFLSSPGFLRLSISSNQAIIEFVQGTGGKVAHSYSIQPYTPLF